MGDRWGGIIYLKVSGGNNSDKKNEKKEKETKRETH
jgi:hypothetical protein